MCSVFRLRAGHHSPVHLPARCRRCWGRCRKPSLPGRPYCQDCLDAALGSGEPLAVAWAGELSEPTSGSVLTDMEAGRGA